MNAAASELLARVKTGAWLNVQTFAPLEWAVPGLIPEGFGLVVGAPKLGKSWLVLGVGLAAAAGGAAFGAIPVEQRPVLYAALEDGDRRMQSRARALMKGEPIPAAFEYFTHAWPSEIIPLIDAWLTTHPGGLVMLDTLGRVMPTATPGESAYQRDYRVGAQLKRLVDGHPGSTLLVVHHTRKMGSSDFMDSTSGTNGLNGSADFTIVLERARSGSAALLKVTGRDVNEAEYSMSMSGGVWTLTGGSLTAAAAAADDAAQTSRLGDRQADVLRYVNDHPDGVTPGQVVDALGIDRATATTYLGRLSDAGRVVKPKRGLYTPVISVISVISDGDPVTGDNTHNTHNTPTDGHGAVWVHPGNGGNGMNESDKGEHQASDGGNETTVNDPGMNGGGNGINDPTRGNAPHEDPLPPFPPFTPQAQDPGTNAMPCRVCGGPLTDVDIAAGDDAHASCGSGE